MTPAPTFHLRERESSVLGEVSHKRPWSSPAGITYTRSGRARVEVTTGLGVYPTFGLAHLWTGRICRPPLSWTQQVLFDQFAGRDVGVKHEVQKSIDPGFLQAHLLLVTKLPDITTWNSICRMLEQRKLYLNWPNVPRTHLTLLSSLPIF